MDSSNLDNHNKIKIKSVSTYEVLDAAGNKVCQEVKQRWAQYKNSNVTAKVLLNYFESSSNPYVAALEMMVNAQDFFMNKQNSLAIFVIQTFSRWKNGKGTSLLTLLTDNIKFDAFNLLLGQRNAALLNLVIREFRLADNKLAFLQPLRTYLKETRNYKETCDWALGLHLYDHFSLEDFVIPLFLQGKFQVAQLYLEKNRCLRVPMVAFLDSLLMTKHTESELSCVAKRLQVNEVKMSQLGYKSVSKLITKLLKTFNLPPSLAPNLMKNKGRGALSFLLHKKFVEKSISADGWAEMVVEAVQSDASLQVELVAGVANQGDLKNAFEWALKFNVPKHKWPIRLQQFVDRDELHTTSSWLLHKMEWDKFEERMTNEMFHKLRIPESSIILTDTLPGLESFLEELTTKDVRLVGLDAEWKPTFGFKKCDLALIQIATREKVYIMDMIKLSSGLSNSRERPEDNSIKVWEKFATGFFGNPKIIKLGFGMGTDLTAIRDIFRKRGINKLPEIGFLDLSTMAVSLVEEHKFVFPHGVPKVSVSKDNSEESQISIGLNNLVKMTLGKNLNKSDQFSNWERRPLRRDQILYAALDAYVLLEVYDALVKECERQKISFEEVMNGLKNFHMNQKRSRKKKGENDDRNKAPKSVSQFRVLCDKPLIDLGKLLRKCGVDTIIADMKQYIRPTDVKGKVPLCVITQRPDYHRFRKLGHVYCVRKKELKDQIFEVLQYFNVKVSEEDLHTRCKECNSNEFEEFSREELEKLAKVPENNRPEQSSKFYEDVSDIKEFTDRFVEQSYIPSPGTTGRGKTKNGVIVRYSDIPPDVLKETPVFFVCTVCGKCYWEGNQKEPKYEKVLKDIVNN